MAHYGRGFARLCCREQGLAGEVAALRTELNSLSTTGRADLSRLESEATRCRSSLVSVHSELGAERTKVSRLMAEADNLKAVHDAMQESLAEAHSELRDWDEQYKFQIQEEAGANNRPKEEKSRES